MTNHRAELTPREQYLHALKDQLSGLHPDNCRALVTHDIRNLFLAIVGACSQYKKNKSLLFNTFEDALPAQPAVTAKLVHGQLNQESNQDEDLLTQLTNADYLDLNRSGLELNQEMEIIAKVFEWFAKFIIKDNKFAQFFNSIYESENKPINERLQVNTICLNSARFFLDPQTIENIDTLEHIRIGIGAIGSFFHLSSACLAILSGIELNGLEAVLFFNHFKNAMKSDSYFTDNGIVITLSDDHKTITMTNRSHGSYGDFAGRANLPILEKANKGYGSFIIKTMADLASIVVDASEKEVVESSASYYVVTFTFTKATEWKKTS